MLFSEAVMLGSTQIRLQPTVWLEHELGQSLCGCLIGMAAFSVNSERTGVGCLHYAIAKWPWLAGKLPVPSIATGWGEEVAAFAYNIISTLALKVFYHKITLEQALDWIRSVEPKEEETHVAAESSDQVGQLVNTAA